MNWLLAIQNQLLDVSLGLYPLLGLVYSFASSWHCTLMCAPLVKVSQGEGYFKGRILSYTLLGALLGGFGSSLRQTLEFQSLAALAFCGFLLATLLVIGVRFWRGHGLPASLQKHMLHVSGWQRGFLSAFIPCHLLYFFYGLAVLSTTFWGGALILFAHAVATTPALAYGQHWLKKWHSARLGSVRRWVVIFVVAISFLNLFYFGSRIFLSEDEARARLLFCL